MDAESGKAEGGQNRAHNGAGQIAADQQDIGGAQQTDDSHVNQCDRHAVHQYEVRYRAAGMLHQFEQGAQAVFAQEQTEKHGGRKIQAKAGEQPEGPSIAPDKYAAAFQAERLQDTHHHKGEKTSGKPHVKKIVAHVHGGGMYGERRQNKAGKNANGDGNSQIGRKRERQKVNKLRHHRGQTGAEKSCIDIAVHARAVEFCIEPCSQQHGEYIYGIFAEKGKPGVDKKDSHRKACERNFLQADQKDGHTHYQPRIEESCAEAGQLEIICHKGVPGKHNGNHAAQEFVRRSQKKGRQKQKQGCCGAEGVHLFSFQSVSDFFSHRQILLQVHCNIFLS